MKDRMQVNFDPALQQQMSSAAENAQRLHDMIERSKVKHEPVSLSDVALRKDPMSPYDPPKIINTYNSLDEVINHKLYHGTFPESFSKTHDYFLNSGISPYYEIPEIVDYTNGVFTINTMIDLTVNGLRWRLKRPQDIYEIITITEEYQRRLQAVITEETTNANIERRAYNAKLEIFLKAMHDARRAHEFEMGKRNPVLETIDDLLKKFLNILK